VTAIIWIDWYSYHISRLRALAEHESLKGKIAGIELVGGCGVHAGMRFRDHARDGLPITSLFPSADWKNTGQLRLALAIWRQLRILRPDTVLIPGYYTMPALAAALWAKCHRRRSVLMSETTRADHPRAWWKEFGKRFIVQALFDAGICGGKPHARYLYQLGFSDEKVARYYDVVDNAYYKNAAEAHRSEALRPRLGLPERYFLYVGRLAPEKNVSGLLDAFAHYRSSGGPSSLVLVGDGSERSSLERQAGALGIGNCVHFAGLKKTRETTLYYALAECLVLASLREPWGLVVNEAMASGLPVIVSNRCGCAEDLVATGRNGFVFDPSHNGELSTRLLAMSDLREMERRDMGNESQRVIAEYSPVHWASEVARLIQ